MKPKKPRGLRASQNHPWTGKPQRAKRSGQPSGLPPRVREILARTAADTATMATRREGADLTSYKHLKVMVTTGPRRPGRSFRKSANEYGDDG